MSSLKSTFTLERFPNKRRSKKIKFYFSLFANDTIGLVVTIGKKEYKMVTFSDIEELKTKAGGFTLTQEEIMFASRILQQI